MTQHKVWIAACACLVAGPGWAEPGPRLADVASRIDYGFYARDTAVVEAARDELAVLPERGPWRDYYRGYAAMRLAELQADRGREAARLLETCVEHAELATSARETAIEAWILVGGCSALAAAGEAVRAAQHERRKATALTRAREIDRAHPRIGVVETWGQRGDGATVLSAAASGRLEAAVEAFAHWPRRYTLPAWGEAEARAALGAAYLARGDARRARDHLEQALIVAPGYRDALDLLARVRER